MLAGKTILVTGGLGRLGLAIGAGIEARGGSALLTSRDVDRVAAYNNHAAATGQRARAVVMVTEKEEGMAAFVDELLRVHTSIDGLVNNAYPALPHRNVEDVDWAHWMETARVGLGLPCTLARLLVEKPSMPVSSVVNVASMYGVVAPDFSIYPPDRNPSAIYYGAIKAGLIQQTRYLAAWWAKRGVRVNAVSPGGILDNQDQEFLRRYNATVPMQRMVTGNEVASTICFLLSVESSGITGENILVDGGRTIR
jgi:NAD(P)-dependent dehydrogenase (short-subunit alcohol dehydrogenase family)